jgi:co-chaperonin GroES (HSP10)
MRTLDLFVVELNSQTNEKIVTKSGLELYVDTKFNEFEHRVTEGPVVSTPLKYDTGVEINDTLYFHHHVVLNSGQAITGHKNHFFVRYSQNETHGNQAIAYKSQRDNKIRPLSGWSLLEPVEEKDEKKSSLIEVVEIDKKNPNKGRVCFDAPWLEDIGVKAGDVVGFVKNADYRITIDGKEYYRTRKEDLLYVEESVHNS